MQSRKGGWPRRRDRAAFVLADATTELARSTNVEMVTTVDNQDTPVDARVKTLLMGAPERAGAFVRVNCNALTRKSVLVSVARASRRRQRGETPGYAPPGDREELGHPRPEFVRRPCSRRDRGAQMPGHWGRRGTKKGWSGQGGWKDRRGRGAPTETDPEPAPWNRDAGRLMDQNKGRDAGSESRSGPSRSAKSRRDEHSG